MGKLRNAVLAAPEDDPVVDQTEDQTTPTEDTSTNEGGEVTEPTTDEEPVEEK